MESSQSKNGKSFEYACLKEVVTACRNANVDIIEQIDEPFNTAKQYFEDKTPAEQAVYSLGARAPVPFILDCEPNLSDPNVPHILTVSLQTDSRGQAGDVRDILFKRTDHKEKTRWECGISCKHNHDALKHPRINIKPPAKDLFEDKWAPSFRMSPSYAEICKEIYLKYEDGFRSKTPWKDYFKDKVIETCVYQPINRGVAQSIEVLKNNSDFVREFFIFCVGKHDFYKVIMNDNDRTTRVTVFNFNRSLGIPTPTKKDRRKTTALDYPTYIISVVQVSPSTFHVNFDGGWAFSFRLHTADTQMLVSGLKYDVRLVGVPFETTNLLFPW